MGTLMTGKQSITFPHAPYVLGSGSVAGKKEGEGPLGKYFDAVCEEPLFGEDTWEAAESALQRQACVLASQLVVNCIDHGLLLNIVLIPSTTSFFMIDVLKSAIKFLLPSLSEAAEQQFQRDLNRLMSVLVHPAMNRRRSSTTAPGRSAIIATRSRTQPSS